MHNATPLVPYCTPQMHSIPPLVMYVTTDMHNVPPLVTYVIKAYFQQKIAVLACFYKNTGLTRVSNSNSPTAYFFPSQLAHQFWKTFSCASTYLRWLSLSLSVSLK